MRDIYDGGDIDVTVAGSGSYTNKLLRHYTVPYGCAVLSNSRTISIPRDLVYLQSGQIEAMLPGMKGAAEYEKLLNKPGDALKAADAISSSHTLIIVGIIIGNVSLFLNRRRKIK